MNSTCVSASGLTEMKDSLTDGGMRTVNEIRLQEMFVSYLQIMSNVSYVSLFYQLVE